MALTTIFEVIETAQNYGASDIFLGEGLLPSIKLNGKVEELEMAPLKSSEIEEFWRACGADPQQQHDFDSSFQVNPKVRMRASFFRQSSRLGVVLRNIRSEIPTLEQLGVPAPVYTSWLQRRSGLILVTGGTGVGKSTTVAAGLNWLNQNAQRHIVTIEDPIEYMFTKDRCYFTQREVGADTTTFARGLRGALRQAPDVIFIGEIRDAETAQIALQACETGLLVVSTLHTVDAADTLERLNGMFPHQERQSCLMLLSAQLVGIMSQMLLPKPDGVGVTLVVESLENTGAIRNWIRDQDLPRIRDFLHSGNNQNSSSFIRSLVAAVKAGQVDPEVAERASPRPADFARALRGLS